MFKKWILALYIVMSTSQLLASGEVIAREHDFHFHQLFNELIEIVAQDPSVPVLAGSKFFKGDEKTRKCRFYWSGKRCPHKSKCHFAHELEDYRPLSCCEKICKEHFGFSEKEMRQQQFYEGFGVLKEAKGDCLYGHSCIYAHSLDELEVRVFRKALSFEKFKELISSRYRGFASSYSPAIKMVLNAARVPEDDWMFFLMFKNYLYKKPKEHRQKLSP